MGRALSGCGLENRFEFLDVDLVVLAADHSEDRAHYPIPAGWFDDGLEGGFRALSGLFADVAAGSSGDRHLESPPAGPPKRYGTTATHATSINQALLCSLFGTVTEKRLAGGDGSPRRKRYEYATPWMGQTPWI